MHLRIRPPLHVREQLHRVPQPQVLPALPLILFNLHVLSSHALNYLVVLDHHEQMPRQAGTNLR